MFRVLGQWAGSRELAFGHAHPGLIWPPPSRPDHRLVHVPLGYWAHLLAP